MEGALLLALFASANLLEAKLAGSAQGDLRALWATVPKEANRVVLLEDGTPDLTSLEMVPADTMDVGSYALVRILRTPDTLLCYHYETSCHSHSSRRYCSRCPLTSRRGRYISVVYLSYLYPSIQGES